jgi:hypothetical protein
MRTLPGPEQLRDLVTKASWSIAAADLPAETTGQLIALPHAANLGAGAAYVHWTPGIVVEPGTVASWRVVERGQELSGSFTVHSATDIDGEYPPGAKAPYAARRSALMALGRAARFQLVESLERHVTELLEASNRLVAREIEGRLGDEAESWAPTANHGVTDKVGLEALATELLWGSGNQPDSVVLRMVDRAATTHINNQPLGSWFDTNLRARSEEAVRRHIGDPHIGRKIRRLAREQSPSSIEELLEMYKRAHPRESVGRDRVIAALSADKTLDSVSYSLSLLSNVREDEELDAPLEVSDESEAAA